MVAVLEDWIKRFGVVLLGLFINSLEAATTHCDPGWVYNAGRCYFFNTNLKFQQPMAKTECANLGATLVVTIRDWEDKWLRNYLNSTYEPGDSFWNGLEAEPDTNRTFKWGECTLDFDPWYGPNPDANMEKPLCVRCVIRNDKTVNMADVRCDMGEFGYICEKPGVRVLDSDLIWEGTAKSSKLSGSFSIEQEIQADSKTECFIHCAKEVGCEAFSYNEETKMCRILTIACNGNQHENELPWKTFEMH